MLDWPDPYNCDYPTILEIEDTPSRHYLAGMWRVIHGWPIDTARSTHFYDGIRPVCLTDAHKMGIEDAHRQG